MLRLPVLFLVGFFWSGTLLAQAPALSLVQDVAWAPFRENCQELLKGLHTLKAPLPAETVKAVHSLLESKPDNPRVAAEAVQKLLDRHCLIGVVINPESRVKAVRGPRRAELVNGQVLHVLVKVQNDGGVTHALSVASEQAFLPGKKDRDRWVEMTIVNSRPFANRLTGNTVEYRVLRLVARETGKREATLAFDVGQGSQDLGFRAEVPILFRVTGAR